MDADELPMAGRARWLAELAVAIEQAELAAQRMHFADTDAAEVRELRASLERVKREVEELRLGRWRAQSRELGSKRIILGRFC